jgi:spermidine synthase
MAAVAVVEDAAGTRTLHIDNRQQEGSNRSTYADARQALLPLLRHPSPHRALFLGVGTGVTASAATLDPGLQVDAVELVPEVLDTLPWFAEAVPRNTDPARLRLIAADARRYVRAAGERYDLVVADNFHPARSGTGALYSREHFSQVRQRLAPGGLFCQWLPLHQLDMESLASIVHSYMEVFPDAVAILATNSLDTPTLGLVARVDAAPPTAADLARRIRQLPPSAASSFALEDLFAVLGSVVGGPESLRQFGDTAPANTDDRPVVAYRAPFETYAPSALPRDRLLAVVDAWQARPADVIAVESAPAGMMERLQRYWVARNLYLHTGRDVRPVADLRGMLEQVRAPLLAVLRISPDFQPAWDPLFGMASALAQEDPVAGKALLAEMSALRPGAAGEP